MLVNKQSTEVFVPEAEILFLLHIAAFCYLL